MDYYMLLGLARDCTKQEIKRAYHRAAMQYHPDKLGPKATENDKEKFVYIQRAYEVLSDDEKRREYDLFGEASMHRPQAPVGPLPICIEVRLSLAEVISGITKYLEFSREVLFEGDHEVSVEGIMQRCDQCVGGMKRSFIRFGPFIFPHDSPCGKCSADGRPRGYINPNPDKYRIESQLVKFAYWFPEGIQNGESIIFKNRGQRDFFSVELGDVVLTVKYDLGSFGIENGNLLHTQTVSIFEAITGTSFFFEHPNGEAQILKIPPFKPGYKLIIKNFGIPQRRGAEIYISDLILNFEIIYLCISEAEKNILRREFSQFYHQPIGEITKLHTIEEIPLE